MMTVTNIFAALTPQILGAGIELMQRTVAPVLAGMVTATLLTLFVIPALFLLWHGRHLPTAPTRFTNDRKGLHV